jgi:peptidylprolyl isomerase
MRIVLSVISAAILVTSASCGMAKPAPKAPALAAPTAADWRTVDPENVVVIDTNKGRIIVELASELAPTHVQRIKELTREGFYNGLKFHRVIADFMAQTGDPLGTGEGGSTRPDLTAEFTYRRGPDSGFTPVSSPAGAQIGIVGAVPVSTQIDDMMALTADGKVQAWGLFCPGVLGMARGDNPNSANSQFFLMREAYPALDKRYTALGRVISGLPVVRALKVGEPVIEPDVMVKVQMLADMPVANRPVVKVVDSQSAWFKAAVAGFRASQGADFSICDIDLPAQVR